MQANEDTMSARRRQEVAHRQARSKRSVMGYATSRRVANLYLDKYLPYFFVALIGTLYQTQVLGFLDYTDHPANHLFTHIAQYALVNRYCGSHLAQRELQNDSCQQFLSDWTGISSFLLFTVLAILPGIIFPWLFMIVEYDIWDPLEVLGIWRSFFLTWGFYQMREMLNRMIRRIGKRYQYYSCTLRRSPF